MSTTTRHPAAGPRETVGFIGLGNMGGPMAANLQAAGFPLVVHDVRRGAGRALVHSGAQWADSPAEVGRAAALVCTSVPGPTEMEAVFFGADGLASAMGEGSLLVDFTTNAPTLVRQLHGELKAAGASMLDAPVSGGVSGAKSRRLTVQIGGAAADVERARPVLEAMAETLLHVGDVGTGNVCKVLHNSAVFGANLALIESLTAGIKAGVDPTRMIRLFQKSGIGRNHDLQVALPVTLFRGDFAPRFLMTTALKDLRLALEVAQEGDVPMRVAALCEEEMSEAIARGWGGLDHVMYMTLQEERAGVAARLADEDEEGTP